MGTPEHDLALHEQTLNAEEAANDLRVRKLNAAFAEIGTWSGQELWDATADLTHDQYIEVYGLIADLLRDYPPEEVRDKVYLASRVLRARLAELATEEGHD